MERKGRRERAGKGKERRDRGDMGDIYFYCAIPLSSRVVKGVVSLAVIQILCRVLDREYLVVSVGKIYLFMKCSVRPLFLRILTKFRRTLKFSVLC